MLAASAAPALCPFFLSWNLAWLLWPLLTLSNNACQDTHYSLVEVPGMDEKWWPHESVHVRSTSWLRGPSVTYVDHTLWTWLVFRNGVKAVLWPQAALFSRALWVTGNEGWLGASEVLTTESLSDCRVVSLTELSSCQQRLHESALFHRPVTYTLHGQYTKEVRFWDCDFSFTL